MNCENPPSLFPAKERVKKSRDPTTLRHSRESGNSEAAVRNVGPVFLRKTPQRIPAFAGTTKYCRRVVVSHGAVFSGAPTIAVRDVGFLYTLEGGREKSRDANTLRHSRESGNPEAAVRNVGPVFLRKTPQRIPAFAGMTSICKSARFLHTLFRGNDEVLPEGCRLPRRRFFRCSDHCSERRWISLHARRRARKVARR